MYKSKEDRNRAQQGWSAKNKDKIREYGIKRRESNPAKRLLVGAKKRGQPFDIDESDIPLPEYCPYLNIKIDYSAGNGHNKAKPSIDRIDNSKGYIKGNVEVISKLANTMKNQASPEELYYFAREIFRRYHDNY